jgi:hypothetical protein
MINAKLVYKDEKEITLNVPEKEFQKLFECLSQRKVFWDEKIQNGFWTNLEEIRFIQFRVIEEKNEQPQPSNSSKTCSADEGQADGAGECGSDS